MAKEQMDDKSAMINRRSPHRAILQIAVPAIISNITVPLLGLVDQTIVGHLGSPSYIAAVAIGSMIFNVFYWLMGFLRMSTSGLAAQAIGACNRKESVRLLIQALFISQIIACLLLIAQTPLKMLSFPIMGVSSVLSPLVSEYYNIGIWGAPAVLGSYAVTGWFIGMQNTRIPMLVSIIQVASNILLSLLFVYMLNMKIEGVVLGTLSAQWIGFLVSIIAFFVQYKSLWHCKPKLSQWYDKSKTSAFFAINRDIFLRTLCLVAVNMFFTSLGAHQGTIILSANALLLTFSTLFSYIMDGFAYAAEALCGKYKGAGHADIFKQTVRHLWIWAAAMIIVFTIGYTVGGEKLLALLTNEHSVLGAAQDFMVWACLIPLCGCAAYIYDGIYIGVTASKHMLYSAAISTCIFFLVLLLFFPAHANHALWIAYLSFLGFRGLIQCLFYHFCIKKRLFQTSISQES